MRKMVMLVISSVFFLAGIGFAAELPAKDVTLLKEVGIPLYDDVEFINGGLGDEMVGARFASSAGVEDVRKFYRSRFPSWALNSEYGAWILYDGKPSPSPAAYIGKKQIMVQENKNLPDWFGVDKKKTTEIIIVVPK